MRGDNIYALVKEANNGLVNRLLRVLEVSGLSDRQFKAMRKMILDQHNENLRRLDDQIQRCFSER